MKNNIISTDNLQEFDEKQLELIAYGFEKS